MSEGATNPFPIVGVGASAGGLDALTQLISALPPNPGLAMVVIQHLDPHHESQLAGILQSHASLTVVDASHGIKVLPDHVYVIQPNTSVAIADGVLSVTPRPDSRQPHYPVDHFLRSLAVVQGPHAVGVILSGTGSDGTLGIGEIKAAGGVTFAQDDESAQYDGMPQSAVESGAVDLVLPPREIASRLAALPHDPYLRPRGPGATGQPVDDSDQFQRVIAALRKTSGVDFSLYRDTTLKRRTARRMLLRAVASPNAYAELVEKDKSEADALFHDVLINVTSFFRDPEMFEDLKRQVFPELLKSGSAGTPIRIWVPGCSTGQEAYSIAMALLEYLDTQQSARGIQVFATDLDDVSSLDKARAGVYPESIEAEVSADRLRRFFVKDGRTYRILKSVRDMCVFARQNITVDPPFSRVDLVTCRNVLIYMSTALQDRLLPIFHFALNRGGFMVLGLAETAGSFGDLFELVNRTQKIYRKKEGTRRPPLTFMPDEWLAGLPKSQPGIGGAPAVDFQREAERVLLSTYAPPSVLVNDENEIQHFRGQTSPFLEAPVGKPTTNILRMARPGVFTELRSALAEARATRSPVARSDLRVVDHGVELAFTLRVLPVMPTQSNEMSLLVLFETEQAPWRSVATASPGTAGAEHDVEWLRGELASSKQYLQSIVEQQDVTTQELRAAHEEVLSSNEELQSTNEELETTKEELQSANEELTTVNEQFQNRNHELGVLTDDLSNFISSADVPMVTVGRDLRIRRLTPAAQRAFNLLASDVGRSIEHIKFAFPVEDIGAAIETVITAFQPWQHEVTDREGRWWLVRVQPYRTADDRIEGATIVAIDIDLVKRSHALLEERDAARAVVHTVREPLAVLNNECRLALANRSFYDLFRLTPQQAEGTALWESEPSVWAEPSLRRALQAACGGTEEVTDREIERTLPNQGLRTLVINARPIVRAGRPLMLLLAVEDVTAARAAEALRIDAETLRLVDRRKDEFLGILAHELRNPLAPMRFALELLKRSDEMPASAARQMQILERQLAHMVRIIDDLLDVSRISQGKLDLRKEVVSLASLVTSAVELARPAIETARHGLTVSLPDEPILLRADPVRLTQVLANLLNNAVKFTPRGGHIWLIAETLGHAPDLPDQVRIRIRDNGIGIAPDVRPKIFDLFMQGDRSLERTSGGLGVGLTLVRNLVNLHGGSVEVRSDGANAGTEVIVDLPLEASVQPARDTGEAPPTARSLRPLRVLVADDNEDAREMLSAYLQSEGHIVATAVDGEDALSRVAEFQPDVAILDLGMPGRSGYDVVRQLRRSRDASLVLLALSGLGQDEDRARAMEAGFDRHFTKPVDIATLAKALADVDR